MISALRKRLKGYLGRCQLCEENRSMIALAPCGHVLCGECRQKQASLGEVCCPGKPPGWSLEYISVLVLFCKRGVPKSCTQKSGSWITMTEYWKWWLEDPLFFIRDPQMAIGYPSLGKSQQPEKPKPRPVKNHHEWWGQGALPKTHQNHQLQ